MLQTLHTHTLLQHMYVALQGPEEVRKDSRPMHACVLSRLPMLTCTMPLAYLQRQSLRRHGFLHDSLLHISHACRADDDDGQVEREVLQAGQHVPAHLQGEERRRYLRALRKLLRAQQGMHGSLPSGPVDELRLMEELRRRAQLDKLRKGWGGDSIKARTSNSKLGSLKASGGINTKKGTGIRGLLGKLGDMLGGSPAGAKGSGAGSLRLGEDEDRTSVRGFESRNAAQGSAWQQQGSSLNIR